MGKSKDSSVQEEDMEVDDEQQQQNQGNSSSLSNDNSLYEVSDPILNFDKISFLISVAADWSSFISFYSCHSVTIFTPK